MSDVVEPNSNEFVVDDQLLHELERRGIHTTAHIGDVVRLQLVRGYDENDGGPGGDPFANFIGRMHAGEDFSTRAEELLQDGFGRS